MITAQEMNKICIKAKGCKSKIKRIEDDIMSKASKGKSSTDFYKYKASSTAVISYFKNQGFTVKEYENSFTISW